MKGGGAERESKEKSADLIIFWFFEAVFALSLLYGLFRSFAPGYDHSQANLIIVQSAGGLVLAALPTIAAKTLRLDFRPWARIAVEIFGFLAIVLGEAFRFYYRYDWWDDMLHAVSGFGIALLACGLAEAFLEGDKIRHPAALCIAIGVLVSLSSAMLWEIYEFSLDEILGLNMQKIIPENILFNGGDTTANLMGTDAQIAAFYRTPAGYGYALMDTMSDMIQCLFGAVVFLIYAFVRVSVRPKEPFRLVAYERSRVPSPEGGTEEASEGHF